MENANPKLSLPLMENLLTRINQIVRCNTIPEILLQWIQDSLNTGKISNFSRETQNELLDTLHEIASTNDDIGENANQLYNQIINLIKK